MEDMDAIYRRHAHTVYKFLLAQCRDPDLAEELTQETFYQAVRSIGRFDGSCKLSVWLCQIAKHLWYQQLRKRQKAPVPLDRLPEVPVPSAEDGLLEQEGRLALLGRSTACRSFSGRWSTSGPSAASASGRSGTCWTGRRPGHG